MATPEMAEIKTSPTPRSPASEIERLQILVGEVQSENLNLHVRIQMDAYEKNALEHQITQLTAKLEAKSEEVDFFQTKSSYLQFCYLSSREKVEELEKKLQRMAVGKKQTIKDQPRFKVPFLPKRFTTSSVEKSAPIVTPIAPEVQSAKIGSSTSPTENSSRASNTNTNTISPTASTSDVLPTSSDNVVVVAAATPVAKESKAQPVDDDILEITDVPATTGPVKTYAEIFAEWSADKRSPEIEDNTYWKFLFNPNGLKMAPQKVNKVVNSVGVFREWREVFGQQTMNKLNNTTEAWNLLTSDEKAEWKKRFVAVAFEQKKQLQNGWIELKPPEKRHRKPTSSGQQAKKIKLEPIGHDDC